MISIIVPAYNAEKYLDACLESILTQDACMEVIVVDDGSTDSTYDIAVRHGVKAIRQPNKGLSSARNTGLDNASGKWVLFVDADDCLMPGALRHLLDAASDTGCDIVIGGFIKGESPRAIPASSSTPLVFASNWISSTTLYQTSPDSINNSVCGKLYASRLFTGERFTEGLYYEDLDIFYRIYRHVDRIAVINVPVYFYRTNHGSILHRFDRRRLDALKVTERMENDIAAPLKKAARDRRLIANFNAFALITANDHDGIYTREADMCWSVIRELRMSSLLNPRVRAKNKAGIILSFFGKRIFKAVARIFF